jgi:hypothetical protein
MEKSLKGASFIAATMCECQREALDMLMYYDARPCAMNGLFNTDFVCDCLKGYYPFKMFNELYKLDASVSAEADEDIYITAAKSDTRAGIMLTHYNDNDDTEAKAVTVDLKGFGASRAEFYLLDENNDMSLVKTEVFTGDNYSVTVNMPVFTTYLIVLEK